MEPGLLRISWVGHRQLRTEPEPGGSSTHADEEFGASRTPTDVWPIVQSSFLHGPYSVSLREVDDQGVIATVVRAVAHGYGEARELVANASLDDETGLPAIRSDPRHAMLRVLDLTGAEMRDDGVAALLSLFEAEAQHDALVFLQSVVLGFNGITDAGAERVASFVSFLDHQHHRSKQRRLVSTTVSSLTGAARGDTADERRAPRAAAPERPPTPRTARALQSWATARRLLLPRRHQEQRNSNSAGGTATSTPRAGTGAGHTFLKSAQTSGPMPTSPGGGGAGANVLDTALAIGCPLPNLDRIDLTDNDITDTGLAVLLQTLNECTTLGVDIPYDGNDAVAIDKQFVISSKRQ